MNLTHLDLGRVLALQVHVGGEHVLDTATEETGDKDSVAKARKEKAARIEFRHQDWLMQIEEEHGQCKTGFMKRRNEQKHPDEMEAVTKKRTRGTRGHTQWLQEEEDTHQE